MEFKNLNTIYQSFPIKLIKIQITPRNLTEYTIDFLTSILKSLSRYIIISSSNFPCEYFIDCLQLAQNVMNYIRLTIKLFFWVEGLKGYDNKAGYRLCNRYHEHEMIKTVINKYCAALLMIYRILIAIIPETKILRCFAFD